MKWGIPSEPAWAYLRERHPDLVDKGEEAFRIAGAYDAGRYSIVNVLIAEKVQEVVDMADEAARVLGGTVQLLDSQYDPATHRITFTWERR